MSRSILLVGLAALLALLVYLAVPRVASESAQNVLSPIESAVASSGTTFASSQRMLARTPDGTLYLTYLRPVDGHDQVFVTESTTDGRSWGNAARVSSGNTNATDRHLMVDRRGNLHLFWTQYAVPDPGTGEPVRQIFWSRFDGTAWSTPEQLTRDEYNGVPSATVDSQGRIHLVWYGFDGEYYQIVYSRFSDGDWSDPRTISDGYPDSVNPAIAVDSEDNLHVVWYKFTHASKTYQVFHRQYEASREEWLGQRMLSDDLFTATNVSLAITPDDRVIVVYEGLPEPNASALYARVYDGGRWRMQEEIVSPDVDAGRPSVAVDRRGRAYAFHRQGADQQIHLVRSTEEGEWADDRPISASGRNDYPNVRWSAVQEPATAALDLVWTEIDADPDDAELRNLIQFRRMPLPGASD